MNEFSVLISIYSKEIPIYFHKCLESLYCQTLHANEIVIVKDGILTNELEYVLSEWKEKLPLKIIGYEENKGLIYALNFGIKFCSYELIARMDSDDICLPDRFKKQIDYFSKNQDVVLLSGYISEFNKEPNDIYSIRKVPTGNLNIEKYLKKRSAFNHMAVMYKKSVVSSVGAYQGIKSLEDYDLWIRIIMAGYKADNLQEVIVYARIGNNMIGRRSGLVYAKKEIKFLLCQRKRYFISNFELIKLLFTRIPLRLLPTKILTLIYSKYLR